MQPSIRIGVAALSLAVMCVPAHAAVLTLNTDDHPLASSLTLTLGFVGSGIEDSIGPTPVHGTMVVDVNLDASDSGTFTINSTSLILDNIGPETLNLGAFGTVDIAMVGIEFSMAGGPITATNSNFSITTSTPGGFGFVDGFLVLTNATGFLGSIAGPDPDDIDLLDDPAESDFADLVAPLVGTIDLDSGLNDADGAEVNLPLSVNIDLGSGLYLRVDAAFHVGTAIPEAGSMLLMGMGVIGVVGAVGGRRVLRRSRCD